MARTKTAEIKVRNYPVPWNVGEHMAIIGTTGTGKTYLTARILEQRKYVIVFRTKSDDIKFKGYKKVKTAKALDDVRGNTRIIVEPEYSQQRLVGAEIFERIWHMGGWTIVIDELFYVHDQLKLKPFIDMLLTQGRSKNISVVAGMQRPVHVTRFALSEATHTFSFRLEGRDRKTMEEMASRDFAEATTRVAPFHFAHYHVKSRTVGVGTADRLDKILVPRG